MKQPSFNLIDKQEHIELAARSLKAIAHPLRLKILCVIGDEEACVQQIVDAVKGEDYPVTDRSVDVQMVGLRKKLGACGKYVETVRGVGYRFRE